MWHNFTPQHTQTFHHSHQQTTCGYTTKYLKPITKCEALRDNTLCTPNTQNVSLNHEGTDKDTCT